MHPVVDTRFPNPPGRSERKYMLSSSLDIVGVWSWHRELTGAGRGTGSDHSELAKDMACSLGAAGPDSEAHATSNATDSSASAVAASTDLMVTSRLMPAWRAGGHVEIVAAQTWPVGCEDQRASIEGEARRDVVQPRIQGRPGVHRWRPRIMDRLARGHPQIIPAKAAAAARPEHQLSAVSADRDS